MTLPSAAGLERFLQAQESVFSDVCAELKRGRKESHWMWFIFPQLRGLGRSPTAQFYGIVDRAEAESYWSHAVLRERLLRCTQLVLSTRDLTVHQIFGSPDDFKLQSCMTLFSFVASGEPAFDEVLKRFFDGARDSVTLSMLR